MNVNLNKEQINYWLLGISSAIIPMPGNNFSSLALILLVVFCLLSGDYRLKFQNLKKNKFNLLLLCIPFVLAIVGLTYTDNLTYGFRKVQMLLPFLLYPLVLFSMNPNPFVKRFVFYCFSFGTLLASLMGMGKALYFRLNHLGDYFYYARFSELVDKHTTYFSLFIVLSFLFLLHEFLNRKLKWYYFSIVAIFWLITLYVVSARISIVGLAIGSVLILYFKLKTRLKWILLMLPILFIGLFALPNFQKRFELNQTEVGQMSDREFRTLHWKSVLETIQHNPILIGSGTGSDRGFLYDTYRNYHLTSAYELEYNAHNQFMEIALDYGLLGFLAFMFMLVNVLYSSFKVRNYFGLIVSLVFVVYFCTESIFQRYDGVVAFSLLISINIFFNTIKNT